jgi:glycosyltransferase involved in cell wall biosynthesis
VKLTVAIPAHNEEAWIGRTLSAVTREARRFGSGVEVLVVDNASTDRTARVARGFPGVRVVAEPVKGLSAARQRSYLAACGELILNVDADVLVPPRYLERIVRAFDSNPRLVLLSGPYLYYDLPQAVQILSMVFYSVGIVWGAVAQHLLHIGAIAQGGNFAVRRSALERVGGYNPSIEFYGEDSDIAKRLAQIGLVRFDMRFMVKTSGRRLAAEGVLATGFRYAMNNLSVPLYGRPLHRRHSDIRTLPGSEADPALEGKRGPVPAEKRHRAAPAGPQGRPRLLVERGGRVPRGHQQR